MAREERRRGRAKWIRRSDLDAFSSFTLAAADLFVYVDGVEGPLVVLHANRGCCHRLVVLGADDDDDQILFLCARDTNHRHVFVFHVEKEKVEMGPIAGTPHFCFLLIYLAKVALHEVNLADAPELLLKDVNLQQEDAVGVLKPFDIIKIFSLLLQSLLRDSPRR